MPTLGAADIQFEELDGSGRIEYADERAWITHEYLIDWVPRFDFLKALVGFVGNDGAGNHQWIEPHQSPHRAKFFCRSAEIIGQGYDGADAASGSIKYKKARVTARYRQDYATDFEDLRSESFAEESVEYGGHFQPTQEGEWRMVGGPFTIVKYPVHTFVSTSERTIIVHNAPKPDEALIKSMRGKVNSAEWHDQATGTVIYAGPSESRELNLELDGSKLFRVTHRYFEQAFSWNEVPVNGEAAPVAIEDTAGNPPYGTWTPDQMKTLLQGV